MVPIPKDVPLLADFYLELERFDWRADWSDDPVRVQAADIERRRLTYLATRSPGHLDLYLGFLSWWLSSFVPNLRLRKKPPCPLRPEQCEGYQGPMAKEKP